MISIDERRMSRSASSRSDRSAPDVGLSPDAYLVHSELSYRTMTRAYGSSPCPSACPSMMSGSSLVEASYPLTRQSSSAADGIRPSDEDFFGVGAGFDHHQMKRSVSSASNKSSCSSIGRRFKEACQRVRNNSSRNVIAPKPSEPASNTSPTLPAAAISAPAEAPPPLHLTPQEAPKLALLKTPYQRPKHPRVHCGQCGDHPDGFRGDHELRRHLNAKHRGVVKKFVCRDPATVGISSQLSVLYPLSDCKACSSGKQYGAYYNAAAHLRRTHFRLRAPRGKHKGPVGERRGGKGGGNWPAMTDLKLWYHEVMVSCRDAFAVDDALPEDEPPDGQTAMSLFPDMDVAMANYALAPNPPSCASADAFSSSPASSAFLGYSPLPFSDPSLDRDCAPRQPFALSVCPPDVSGGFYDPAAQSMPDCIWTMDDVEGIVP